MNITYFTNPINNWNALPIRRASPRAMHIDLNSCFATIEQQANRMLRGRPVGIAAYDSPRGMIIAASYQAKAKGIKLGVNVAEARAIDPRVIIMMPDPAKYRAAHRLFKEVCLNYTDDVTPKSIDEFVLHMDSTFGGDLRSTAYFGRGPRFEQSSPHPLCAPEFVMDCFESSNTCFDLNGTDSFMSVAQNTPSQTTLSCKASLNNTDFSKSATDSIPDILTKSKCAIHEGGQINRFGMCMIGTGQAIKKDILLKLGEAVTVNVGIGPNRFLAKLAAGLRKPDGLDQIDHTNLREVYSKLDLVDLPGINTRFEARLKACGINTPLEFLDASSFLLEKGVFKSITGRHWYLRLRGYEVDRRTFDEKSIGHQYALANKTTSHKELARLLVKLSEKVGRRLRRGDQTAGGIGLSFSFERSLQDYYLRTKSHHSETHKVGTKMYSTTDIHQQALLLLNRIAKNSPFSIEPSPYNRNKDEIFERRVTGISIHVFDLAKYQPKQISLFDVENLEALELISGGKRVDVGDSVTDTARDKRLADAVDALNDSYGEFVVVPGSMMDMKGQILDRIAFGSVRDL